MGHARRRKRKTGAGNERWMAARKEKRSPHLGHRVPRRFRGTWERGADEPRRRFRPRWGPAAVPPLYGAGPFRRGRGACPAEEGAVHAFEARGRAGPPAPAVPGRPPEPGQGPQGTGEDVGRPWAARGPEGAPGEAAGDPAGPRSGRGAGATGRAGPGQRADVAAKVTSTPPVRPGTAGARRAMTPPATRAPAGGAGATPTPTGSRGGPGGSPAGSSGRPRGRGSGDTIPEPGPARGSRSTRPSPGGTRGAGTRLAPWRRPGVKRVHPRSPAGPRSTGGTPDTSRAPPDTPPVPYPAARPVASKASRPGPSTPCRRPGVDAVPRRPR